IMAKRIFDLFFALVGILILLPLFLAIAIWIKLDSPGNVLFRQIRIGRFGREFSIYKFRTMVADAESRGKQITVAKDTRITRSGQFLRKYKLDELPQLFNVVKGE
ncbi:MAG: sugar transferase, partial [Nostoc sp.]